MTPHGAGTVRDPRPVSQTPGGRSEERHARGSLGLEAGPASWSGTDRGGAHGKAASPPKREHRRSEIKRPFD